MKSWRENWVHTSLAIRTLVLSPYLSTGCVIASWSRLCRVTFSVVGAMNGPEAEAGLYVAVQAEMQDSPSIRLGLHLP
ncbi:hypothetical protein BGZ61DRAFT_466579 [Ilyonectria robusta]|uniref:uncharacterized protein n=1 Tax=Ilyonectria robusta TaxID=1079257 RepID=UPI001E8EBCA9|nr:uncharacterized protein BGZ61DRAFT_466579 [Ilyonectria robusta]KAH8656465.1 hypothetical protein BGZ61DRAFT_466579 [Ilyonectria robusta]